MVKIMYTIALRFAENFAPQMGTINAHQQIINQQGFVWYGKLGSAVSAKNRGIILSQENPRILLIHSGSIERYWAYIDDIKSERPANEEFPEYYRDMASKIKTWFRIIRFEPAEKYVISKCTVVSSGSSLSEASRASMNPYFFVKYTE